MSVVLSCLCHVCLVVLLEMLIEESRALGEGGGRRASHVSIKRNNVSVYPRNGLGREKKIISVQALMLKKEEEK